MNGINTLIIETLPSPLLLCKESCLGTRFSPVTESAGALILDFLAYSVLF